MDGWILSGWLLVGSHFIVSATEALKGLAEGDLADIRPGFVLLLGLGFAGGAAGGGGDSGLLALGLLLQQEAVRPRQRRHQPPVQELIQIPTTITTTTQ